MKSLTINKSSHPALWGVLALMCTQSGYDGDAVTEDDVFESSATDSRTIDLAEVILNLYSTRDYLIIAGVIEDEVKLREIFDRCPEIRDVIEMFTEDEYAL